VLLKTQRAGAGVNSGSDKYDKLIWKIPLFGMIVMNFMLVPADMFSVSILIGFKAPASVLNQVQWGFSEGTTGVCTSSKCHMPVCDPSSLVRVTEDLKDFLKPFQTLATMN